MDLCCAGLCHCIHGSIYPNHNISAKVLSSPMKDRNVRPLCVSKELFVYINFAVLSISIETLAQYSTAASVQYSIVEHVSVVRHSITISVIVM